MLSMTSDTCGINEDVSAFQASLLFFLYPGLRFAAAWADNVSGFQPSGNIVCLYQTSFKKFQISDLRDAVGYLQTVFRIFHPLGQSLASIDKTTRSPILVQIFLPRSTAKDFHQIFLNNSKDCHRTDSFVGLILDC